MERPSQAFRADRPTVAELAAGAIVVEPKGPRFLLLHEPAEDRWCFPKGHVEPGETLLEAARREVAEESGLHDLDVHEELGEVSYRFYQPARDRNVIKTSVYFLAFTAQTETTLESTFDEARWAPAPEAARLLRFETDRRMLAAAVDRLGVVGGAPDGVRRP
ncbi:MAG TPA: NUDIX domain-containing protein [Thermoplasmata archaeon]|nr:NUDIX domain-containing protein [Thermoplasmata archaeon]